MAANLTIDLDGKGIPREDVAAAATAIKPGFLIEVVATGVQEHATAAGNAAKTFAVENAALGMNVNGTYAVGDRVQFRSFPVGSRVNAVSSAAITLGDFVESDGAGKVRTLAVSAATAETARASVVGKAIEAAAGADAFVTIEIV